MQIQRTRIPVDLFADYYLRQPAEPKRVFLLLHGFEQTAKKIFAKFDPVLSALGQGYVVLAPNGPFPIPKKVDDDHFHLGCSWYFYDASRDEYYMDMEIGVRFLSGLVIHLGLERLPATLIGFSQGGYLAPFAAQAMPQVDHVIGIGCEFLIDELKPSIGFKMDCIQGVPGEFRLIENGGHRVDEAVLEQAADLIRTKI
jgi:predicted esterase